MPIEDDHTIKEILTKAKTIAVVGASEKPWRDSHRIFLFLKQKGYTVIPVNPAYLEINGVKCFPTVQSIRETIDIVDVFRNSDAVGEVANDAIAAHARVLWLQLGVVNTGTVQQAEAAGMQVVMDRCIAVDYSRLIK
jgi:predicted CoA-binding protein